MAWYYWLLIALAVAAVVGVSVWLGIKYGKNKGNGGVTINPDVPVVPPSTIIFNFTAGLDEQYAAGKKYPLSFETNASHITFKSSDDKVLTMSNNGTELNALSAGNAKIIVELKKGKEMLIKEFNVKITAAAEGQ